MGDDFIRHGRLEALAQRGVHVLDATALQLRFRHLAVEAADVPGGYLFEFATSECGDDVMLHITLVALVGGAADGYLDAVVQPGR